MFKSAAAPMTRITAGDIGKAAAVLLCVSSYPLLFIFASNSDLVQPSDILLPLLLDVVISLALGILITLVVRDLFAGTLITACIDILFFSYGHVFLLLANSPHPALAALGNDLILLPIWLVLLALAVFLILRSRSSLPKAMTPILIPGLALVAIQVFQLGTMVAQGSEIPAATPEAASAQTATASARVSHLPDVYYIILDGYGRDDILKQNFDYDNSEFINGLKQRGFYVAEQSYSNYPETNISLTSSLNMTYHDPVPFQKNPKQIVRQYKLKYDNNQVKQALTQLGYAYSENLTSPSGASDSITTDTSLLLDSEYVYIIVKTSMLSIVDRARTTAAPAEIDEAAANQNDNMPDDAAPQGDSIDTRMSWLPAYAKDHTPTFIFAHYLSPHPPYDYTTTPFEGKADSLDSTPWLDHQAYVREIQALNGRVLKAIDAILAQAETPPIIIIQGDHGPATKFYEDKLNWKATARNLAAKMPEDVRVERFSILNAYYGPPDMLSKLYPTITPVNSFRVVLSYLSTADYPLLPDRSFVATYTTPIEYIELPELHPGTH